MTSSTKEDSIKRLASELGGLQVFQGISDDKLE
jgi:hypothetical protein